MNKIKNGNVIFKEIANKFDNKKITELSKINLFFDTLMAETKGQVILDFLNTNNWDQLESYNIDDKNELLTLIWHDYREDKNGTEIEGIKQMRQMSGFPDGLYSLVIAINNIVPIVGKNFTIFLLNGYAKTENELKKIYCKNCTNFNFIDYSFFEKRIIREINEQKESISFYCTPIYSIAIVPKGCNISSALSKKILYKYNIDKKLKRIRLTLSELNQVSSNEYDSICEKVNTARRIFESVLKIECCYKELEINKNYSEVKLGQLIKLVKKEREDVLKPFFEKMAPWLNEHSHDSGKKINLVEAKANCSTLMAYIDLLLSEIIL